MSNMAALFSEHANLCKGIKKLNAQKARIEAEVATAFKSDFDLQLAGKEYNCGTVNAVQDGWAIKGTVGKDIDYDQAQLRGLYFKTLLTWGDPDEYIKVTFDVEETKYKAWPSPIKKLFEPARTVKPKKMSLSIEKIETESEAV